MSDFMTVVVIPHVDLTKELEHQWDLICEDPDVFTDNIDLEDFSDEEREEWIEEMKELKFKYKDLCDSYSDMLSYQVIDNITYVLFGGMSNFCSSYDYYKILRKIDDFSELRNWLLTVAKESASPQSEGVAELSDDSAENLSEYDGDFELNELSELSEAAAESLSKHEGGLLELNGLIELSDAVAESLSEYDGDLELNGLSELSDTAAESLSEHNGNLKLNGLNSLSNAAAESLSKHDNDRTFHYIFDIVNYYVCLFC